MNQTNSQPDVPRGIEVLVKKASIDAEFRALLMESRLDAAASIGLELKPAEMAMLEAIPPRQLEAIIAAAKVDPPARPAFLGKVAAAMLIALGATAVSCQYETFGVAPDRPKTRPAQTQPADQEPPPPGAADNAR